LSSLGTFLSIWKSGYIVLKCFAYRADPRQDPLLGPLLAELDAMSAQQQRLPQAPPESPAPVYRRNSVPYEPNLTRPPGQSQSNYGRICIQFNIKDTLRS
jgi:hypothetical protein